MKFFRSILLCGLLLGTNGVISIPEAKGQIEENAKQNTHLISQGRNMLAFGLRPMPGSKTKIYNKTNLPVYFDYDYKDEYGKTVRDQDIRLEIKGKFELKSKNSNSIRIEYDGDYYKGGIQYTYNTLKWGYEYFMHIDNNGKVYMTQGNRI